MMKRYFKLLCVFLILYYGCAKMAPEHVTDPPQENCNPMFPESNVTYINYVKNIISTHCTVTCHRGGNTLGPGDFTTFETLRPYTDSFFFRVISNQADMPQGNAPLPKSTRDSLQIWINNCSPEGL
jgi:hypothetical protein